jgi:DNA polymerase V
MPVFALVDCNNFYASCEKLFRPDLKDTPIVVLSNNDGCVVARSREAKLLGIKMGVPVFQIKAEMQRHGILAFSSNCMRLQLGNTLDITCCNVSGCIN